jgi:DNA-binding NtrC family response regulator
MSDPSQTLPKSQRQTLVAPRLELKITREAGQPVDRTLILEGDFFRIGSQESNDLVLSDPRVSRFHCRIQRERDGFRVTDSGSRNGTMLSRVRVRDADLPTPECTLELGDSVVQVRELPAVNAVPILDQASFGDLFGQSDAMRKLFGLLDKVSGSDANVLIEGESGTGKELVASEIVRRGARARKPFVVVDCGSISSNLIESELFGHARGAFTGADKDRVGAFEAADGGTVFLDEIGEMPLDMQPKLLRALEAREVRRVGETKSRKVDVRVIAATNRRLDREVNQGRFREDLYFRLSVITVRVPALRERAGDMELLVNVFLDALGARASRHLFTPELLREMEQWEWPGNVRELRNHIERVVVLGTPMSPVPPPTSSDNLETAALGVDLETPFRDAKEALVADFERRYVTALMDWADGNVSRAARKAKMDRMNLHRLVQRYNLREPSPLKD